MRSLGWETLPDSDKKQYAVVLALEESRYSTDELFLFSPSPIADSPDMEYASLDGPLIAMETRFLGPDRDVSNFRLVESKLETAEIRQALDDCLQNHTGSCHVEKSEELVAMRVVDVIERVVVPYPAGMDYIALSYVWGGISPSPGALENGCLPLTVEDAITVDSLCIDQSPCVTESQIKEKESQLDMMSTIYGCSILVITAVDGKNANSGLAGISAPRGTQVAETINGCTLFTTPASDRWEKERSVWSTRAWTKQEDFLSPRSIYFTSGQVVFKCNGGGVEEDQDIASVDKKYSERPLHPAASVSLEGIFAITAKPSTNEATSTFRNLLVFFSVLNNYTYLQMTNENDSLNAFRGLITAFRKEFFPQGFLHGLPLKSHITSLAWIHESDVVPKRRANFPTWSWTGWEGGVTLPRKLRLSDDDPAAIVNDKHLEPTFLGCHGNELEIEGWVTKLDIRTEPFSEVFVPGREESIATVKEGESNHNNTLPTGRYTCLIIKRHIEILGSNNAEIVRSGVRMKQRDTFFVLALDRIAHRRQAVRRSLLTITLFVGESSDQIVRRKEVLRLI
ncbi:heterokaryon incompatibility protein-domain-containing protein [Penicillium lividum]|nr:heterokaryon incompatibility protein-domain-containing protein [Penicillium lividum]